MLQCCFKSAFLFVILIISQQALSVPIDNVLQQRLDGGIKMDFVIKKTSVTGITPRSIQSVLHDKQQFYCAEILVGSNGQRINVAIDTGSSDLWFPQVGVDCLNDDCTQQGTYNSSSSTTSVALPDVFNIKYTDGTTSKGYYYKDDVTFSGVTLSAAQFAVANTTTALYGMIGIGMDTEEAAKKKYPSFTDLLVLQGLIEQNYYSLYLGSPAVSNGSIIFGGIDDTKYIGNLTTVKVVSKKRLEIKLKTLSFPNGKHVKGSSNPILDSGTEYSYLPASVGDAIAANFNNAYYSSSYGLYIVGCYCPTGTITFTFDKGCEIEVPFASFFSDNGDFCTSNIGHTFPGKINVLGDNFLRSAYVVYYLKRSKISLAQANWS